MGVPQAADVSVEAYDVAGRHVRTLATGEHEAGENTLVWDLRDDDGRALGTGVYLVRARIGDQNFTRRVIVQR
jgi:flagellar hook assembly protein FlgD